MFLSRHAAHVHVLVRGEGLAASMSDYLVGRIEAHIERRLQSDHGLSVREFSLLDVLSRQHDGEGGHLQMKQVADAVVLSQSAATRSYNCRRVAARPPPDPPSVKAGRTIAGTGTTSTSLTDETTTLSGTGRPASSSR